MRLTVPTRTHNSARKTITYANPGTGANGTETDIFTLTGEVIVLALFPYCTTNLGESAGTPELALGVNNDTDLFIASTVATAIDADDFWVDATPTEVGGVALPAALKDIIITDNISCLVGGTNHIDAGVIEYTVFWLPISPDGNLVAA
jgi:hypothetical protein